LSFIAHTEQLFILQSDQKVVIMQKNHKLM